MPTNKLQHYKKKVVLKIKFEVLIMKILFLHDFAHFNILIACFLGVSCTKIQSLVRLTYTV
jgi:hypothetical protein